MKRMIPDYIVHYSRGEPFRSVTNVPLDQIPSVINSLNERNAWGLNRFSDRVYLQQRFEVENRMRAKFIALGGEPILSHPIYFFLGRNPRFEENSLNIGYRIDLSHVDRKTISFSYGDTMLSFSEENRRLAGERYTNPLCHQLFLLENLKELFESQLFPKESALPIEAHLWKQPSRQTVRKVDR